MSRCIFDIGFHKLHLRIKDAAGNWSMPAGDSIRLRGLLFHGYHGVLPEV